jgi:hypothetical protein
VVSSCWCFGTTHRSHFQWSGIQKDPRILDPWRWDR